MDQQAFTEYLKKMGMGEKRSAKAVKTIRKFERSLSREGKNVDQADPKDLDRFLAQHARTSTTKYDLGDLALYYEAKGNDRMGACVAEARYKFTPPFKLRDFLDIDPDHITALESLGIKTNNQLLYAGRTSEGRNALSKETWVPLIEIEKLVKLSDLVRIFAVKATRAKLYYESGVDTVEKMSRWDPVDLRDMLVEFVERTGFPGIATLPAEAEFTVKFAKKLPIVVEFE